MHLQDAALGHCTAGTDAAHLPLCKAVVSRDRAVLFYSPIVQCRVPMACSISATAGGLQAARADTPPVDTPHLSSETSGSSFLHKNCLCVFDTGFVLMILDCS